MIHIVAQKIGSAPQLGQRHGSDIRRCRHRPSVPCHLNSAAQLRCEVRELIPRPGKTFPHSQVTAYIPVVSFLCKNIIHTRLQFRYSRIPWRIAITSQNRKHTSCNRSAPAGSRIIGYIKAGTDSQPLQPAHVFLSLFTGKTAAMSILIFNLNTDYRSAILMEKPFYFHKNSLVIAFYAG